MKFQNKNIIRAILFVFRLNLFLLAYLLYCLNVLCLFLNFKKISREIFTLSAYICSISLGVKFKIDKKAKRYLERKGIHTLNHDNPLDIFVAQCVFRMPTITTVDGHLNSFLPFFKKTLINFGHYNFDYLDSKSRKSAYIFLKRKSIIDRNFLIFPSGSLFTSLTKRFSKSITKLSKKYNLDVITWKISYQTKNDYFVKYDKNPLKFILNRFLSEISTLVIEDLGIYSPLKFKDETKLHEALLKFYLK